MHMVYCYFSDHYALCYMTILVNKHVAVLKLRVKSPTMWSKCPFMSLKYELPLLDTKGQSGEAIEGIGRWIAVGHNSLDLVWVRVV